MTSQKAQIQALLNGIDEVLSKTSPHLPWVMSNDAIQQRQMLEQTRQYLVALQQQQEDEQLLEPRSMSNAMNAPNTSPTGSPSESAQQVLQSVLQEMNYWRVNMLQPLRTEIDALQHQREVLTQEIRRLEGQSHPYGLPQQNQQMLVEFLQAAMAQMQANLSAQVTQMIAAQTLPALQAGDRPDPQNLVALDPAERLIQLQKMQAQSDQLMLKLDATLKVIFESLNRNVQTYQDSLEQGLDRMHSLGQQGEAMFAFFVNRFAQQVGREASSVLQGSQQGEATALPADPAGAVPSNFIVADFLSQVPEPIPARPTSFVPAVPFNLSEEVLDISDLDLSEEPLPASETLELLNQELSQLNLEPVTSDLGPDLDLFAGDMPLPSLIQAQSVAPVAIEPANDLSDLDSALDLLNQLSAEMQTDRSQDVTDLIDLASGYRSDAQSEIVHEPALIASPDSLYDDAFYNDPLPDGSAAEAAMGESLGVDAMTLEQEWFAGLGDPAVQDQPGAAAFEDLVAEFSMPAAVSEMPAAEIPDAEMASERAFASETAERIEAGAAEPIDKIRELTDLLPEGWLAETAVESSDPSVRSDQPGPADEPVPQVELQALPIAEATSETFHLALGLLNQPGLASIPDVARPAVTIEGLETLFEDVPNLPQATSLDGIPGDGSVSDALTAPAGAPEPISLAEDWAQFFAEDNTNAEKKN